MLLSSSNRKYPPFPFLSYLSVVVCLRCLLHHILSLIAYTFPENREFVFIIIVKFMTSANIRIWFGLQIVPICVVQYIISLSSLCKLIWRHWTYKMPVRYILSSVWVTLSIFSLLSIIQYVGLYVFSLPNYLVMIEIIYKLCLIIIIKSEVWTITHCLWLGHAAMVSAVCLSIFFLSFGYGQQDWHLEYQYHQLQMHFIQTREFHRTNYGIYVHEVSQWGIWSWNDRVSVPLGLTAMF